MTKNAVENLKKDKYYKEVPLVSSKPLFKGNICSIITKSNMIYIYNRYYHDAITQEYNVSTNKTTINYLLGNMRGKWITELIDDLTSPLLDMGQLQITLPESFISDHIPELKDSINGNLIIRQWGMTELTVTYTSDNISFIGQWDSINRLKSIRKIHSNLLNNLKAKIKNKEFYSNFECIKQSKHEINLNKIL